MYWIVNLSNDDAHAIESIGAWPDAATLVENHAELLAANGDDLAIVLGPHPFDGEVVSRRRLITDEPPGPGPRSWRLI